MTFEEYVYYREYDAKMEGRLQGRLEEKLENYGEDISNALRERINSETDVEVLKSWLKIAASSNRVEEFCNAAKF